MHATDFVSTEAEKSPQEISQLADVIAQEEVPVIFHDNQANPQAITSLSEAVESRGWTVEVSDEELFADTLRPPRQQIHIWARSNTTPKPSRKV